MLSLWRRHLDDCPFGAKGRKHTKCSCPIWCDGDVDGKRLRKSLETRDWARATRKLALIENPPPKHLVRCPQPGCLNEVERGRCDRHRHALAEAIAAYHLADPNLSEATKRSRRYILRMLGDSLAGRVETVDEITLEHLQAFRQTRVLAPRTWVRDLQQLRHFFKFCEEQGWLLQNLAKKMPMPRNLKPSQREPYQPNEVVRMLAATETLPSYGRRRSRAMLLLLRYTALRISDVVLLKRNRIRDGEIFLRTAKNGKPVKLPVHPELQAALDVLPLPRGADADCPYLFWSGQGNPRSVVEVARRTLNTVFKAAGVKDAMAHRFRHTLATELLEQGGSIEEVADILGDSEAIIRQHYIKWSAGRQARITTLLYKVWHVSGTQVSDTKQVF